MLTTFVSRPQVIDAVQFTGTMLSAQVVRRSVPGVTLEMGPPPPGYAAGEWTGRLLVTGLAGTEPAVVGDFVVAEGPDTYVMDPDAFEARFQRAV